MIKTDWHPARAFKGAVCGGSTHTAVGNFETTDQLKIMKTNILYRSPSPPGSRRIAKSPGRSTMAKTLFVERLRAAVGDALAAPLAPVAGALDPVQSKLLISQKIKQLTEFDPAASECLEANHDRFASLFSPQDTSTFEHQVQAYAFGEAQALLEQAVRAGEI